MVPAPVHADGGSGAGRKLAPGRWPRETIRSLYDIADGWCAGLVLLLDQLRSEGRASPAPREPSSEVLFDYFAGEIFKKAPPAVQKVLLHTAFLPQVTPAMAGTLTGEPTAGEILATLHEQNYFTNKQAVRGEPMYEYHPLFRDFLLSQALRMYSPSDRARIPRTAAGLLHAAGQIEAAARLLRDAEDWATLAQLIQRHAQSLVAQGRAQTLEEWLHGIPAAIFAERHGCSSGGGGSRGGTPTASTASSRRSAPSAAGDTTGMFLAWAGMIFGTSARASWSPWTAGSRCSMTSCRTLQRFLRKGSRRASPRRCSSRPRCGSRPIPRRRTGPSEPSSWRGGTRTHSRAIAAVAWFHHQLQAGDLAKVAAVVDEMRAAIRARDVSPIAAVNASMAVAWYEAAMALPSYRRTVAQMLELVPTTGGFSGETRVLCGGLTGALSDGDLETSAAWLQELERDLHRLGPMFHFWHHWFIVWEALIRGDVGRAATHQPEMLRLALQGGCVLDEVVAHLMSAQVLHARGEEREARGHLDRGFEIGRVMGSAYVEFMARLTEAQLCLDGDHETDGLQALARALALGRERGYVNSRVWIPAVMARLCARALEAGIEVDYVRGLIQKRGLVPESPPVEVEAWPWPIKIFTLGRFEVLRDGEPVRFARKVQRKPLALLKALIAFGGRTVREDLVMDALWPEAEGDRRAWRWPARCTGCGPSWAVSRPSSGRRGS